MRLFLMGLVVCCLGACASTHELKAPCDPFMCKNRTQVNTWNKG